MKNLFLILVLVTLSFFNANRVMSDTTYVSGSIVSQNWNTAGSPYVVTGNIEIAGLSIDPGVTVLFGGNFEFLVQGVIEAIGDSLQPILFTTKAGVTSWKGIRFQNSNPGSFMKWCIVEKANSSGIRIVESLPNLTKCTFRYNSADPYGGGMSISNNTVVGNLIVTFCKFENNLASSTTYEAAGGGVIVFYGNVTFLNCKFIRNRALSNRHGSYGSVVAYGGGVALINGNTMFQYCDIDSNKVSATNSSITAARAVARGGGLYTRAGITTVKNSIVVYDTVVASADDGATMEGDGMYFEGSGQTFIENSSIAWNKNHGLFRNSSTVQVINSIIYFNVTEISGSPNVTYSCVQDGYPGITNIDVNPIFDSNFKILPGSLCIDAGSDSIVYNDGCRPPALGGVRNDMGAHGGPGACGWLYKTIRVRLSALMEGLYNPVSNMMSRSQVQRLFLRNAAPPYNLIDAAAGTIGTNGVSTDFIFNLAPTGTYYLATKNFNCIETWSKSGGEPLVRNNTVYNYDFTSAASKAYGNNMTLKGSKYCIYSGDADQGGSVDATDLAEVDNDVYAGVYTYKGTDINGDFFVDVSDLLVVDNNATNFVERIRP